MEHADLVLRNDFANRSFRDVADRDYIAARMSYRANLMEPFLWSSLQAFEKYFKAILLFNGVSSKGIGHKLEVLLNKVKAIDDIPFDLSNDVEEFLLFIDKYGQNRYLEGHSNMGYDSLLRLDESIWHVRKYCFYMRGKAKVSEAKEIDFFPAHVNTVKGFDNYDDRRKYKIWNGYLESVVANKHESYEALIWKNFYYGKRKKNIVKNYRNHTGSVNPTLTLHPEAYEVLKDLVTFSYRTKNHFENKT